MRDKRTPKDVCGEADAGFTEIYFHQQSLPFYMHHENIKRSQHKDICKKNRRHCCYIEMFLAPYPAIRDPSVQGPGLSNKKIEGPLLA